MITPALTPRSSRLITRELGELALGAPLGRAWEALAMANPASGIMQSLHWAVARRRQGLRVLHLGLFDDERLIGGLLAYGASAGAANGLLVVPEGPVLPWADEALARAGLRQLLAGVASGQAPALALRIEPRLTPPRPRLLRSFARAPIDQLAPETLYLDLTPEPAALLAAMRPKGRYNIRLAERHGVVVTLDRSPLAARRLHTVLAEAGQRNDFFVEPYAFFSQLLESLGPAGHAHCLFASHAGQTLGALLLITYGDRATYLYGGVSNEQRQLMAGYALQWAAIQLARQAGCRLYDFYGYEATGVPDHLFASFSRFKRQFGGTPVRFIGAQDYFFLDQLTNLVIRAVNETQPVTAASGVGEERSVYGQPAG